VEDESTYLVTADNNC